MLARPARTEIEVRDGWGELASMGAGTSRPWFGRSRGPALPVVGRAGTGAYREADCKVLNEVLFASQWTGMRMTVLKRS